VVAFFVVLFGATVVPLTMEVIWRSEGNAALHVQPEVLVVEQAGVRVAHGKDPYQVIDRNGHILIHQTREPVYELYYPYLPGMVIFGFSSVSKDEARLTDARIQFLVFSAVITLVALSRIRPPSDARFRALQALTVLPTAALPLSTGGDDMPVVALMLLGLVALQRRRPLLAGLALGAASSLKFTAWPLVLLALWGAYDQRRHRAVVRYVVGVVVVVVPVIVPVALRNPSAFVDNVIRFPLGLAGVSSPAGSALPGHMLVSAFPGIHRPYVAVVVVVGVAVLIRHLLRKPPRDAAGVAALTGWVMLIAILLAPATRVGYLLYPINLFLWAWMLGQADDPAAVQLPSGSWNSSRENGVEPVDVVGETTAPTSQ
jgi:MYXO-CTERM domain-containing protein